MATKKKAVKKTSKRSAAPQHPLLGLPGGERIWNVVVEYLERMCAPLPKPGDPIPGAAPLVPPGGALGCLFEPPDFNPDRYKIAHLAEQIAARTASGSPDLPARVVVEHAFNVATAFVAEEKKRFAPTPKKDYPAVQLCGVRQPDGPPEANYTSPGTTCVLDAGHTPANTHSGLNTKGEVVDWTDYTLPAAPRDGEVQGEADGLHGVKETD